MTIDTQLVSDSRHPGSRQRARRLVPAALAAALLLSACSSGTSADGGDGPGGDAGSPITTRPTDVFVPSDDVIEKSPLTSQIGMSFVQVQGAIKQFADAATAQATAKDLKALQSVNDSNSSKAVAQMSSFVQRKVGTMFVQDLNPAAQVPVIEKAIAQGMGTFAFNMPSHMQVTASQYEIGKQLAEGTLDYIAKNLDNKAKIVHFNFDYNEAVAPRDKGWREVMEKRPAGVEIVADIPGNPETQDAGNQAMASILQKDPEVNVVDGGDASVLGALSALKAAGREDDPSLALFGVNGDPQAVKEVASGGPYKATYAFNFAILGTLMSDMADRWMRGLNIPQLAIVPAVKIDGPESIAAYDKSLADPASVYASSGDTYFKLYGNTSYATRGSYFDGKVS